MIRLALLVVFVPTLAFADAPRFGIAINNPISWGLSRTDTSPALAIGGSLYAGVGRHTVIRLNAATYDLVGYYAAGDFIFQSECGIGGHVTDAGIGWMYFFGERFRGWSVEGGVVGRHRTVGECTGDFPYQYVDSDAYGLAVRATGGYSVTLADHVYASIAWGLSVGREWGRESGETTDGAPLGDTRPFEGHVHRFTAAPEMFARLGWVFDL